MHALTSQNTNKMREQKGESNNKGEIKEEECNNKEAKYKTADRMLYPILKETARENRKQMTEGERVLWNELRAKKTGYRFLRQHAIGEYIVDFVCLERQVIVEVDGGYHAEALQQMMDTQRQDWLESQGYIVLRYTNEQVEFATKTIIEEIISILRSRA